MISMGGEGDPNRLNALVAQIGAQRPDVIIAITSPAVLALRPLNLTIPVVFAFVPDPVGLGSWKISRTPAVTSPE